MPEWLLSVILLISLSVLAPAISFSSEYIVGEGDVLKITVYAHKDLETVERVSGNGMLNFPLIGQIKVSGLTVSEVAMKISDLLADGYIISPQVAVFTVEFRSQKAVIMGEVVKPGLYELKGKTSFLELVSIAGGLTDDAGETAIVKRKTRASSGEQQIITIDLVGLIEKGDSLLDVPVLEGDSIFVSKAGLVYVTGEVKKPDAYKLEEGYSVIKAITMAGGFTDKASTTKVKIIRKIDGEEEVLDNVNMDEQILSDDVIVVPESFF
jgi:polysaccharide export outer membrane protein